MGWREKLNLYGVGGGEKKLSPPLIWKIVTEFCAHWGAGVVGGSDGGEKLNLYGGG